MSVTSYLARLFLFSKKNRHLVFLLAPVCFFSVFISVYAFAVIYSVMTGFSDYLKSALMGIEAHLTVSPGDGLASAELDDFLRKQNQVARVDQITELDALFQTNLGEIVAVKVRGYSNADWQTQNRFQFYPFEPVSTATSDAVLPQITLGDELYARLPFKPMEAETGKIINPLGEVGPTGEVEPLTREFQVVGLFSTKVYDYDNRYLFIAGSELAQLAPKAKTQYKIYFNEPNSAVMDRAAIDQLCQTIRQKFPSARIQTWQDQNRSLFESLQLEKVGALALISLVLLIASFNIYYFTKVISEHHRRDMAFLHALGLPTRKIKMVFLKIGFSLGLSGSVVALAMTLLTLYWLDKNPVLLPPAYYLDILPIAYTPLVYLLLLTLAPLLALFCSYWPAHQAARLNPSQLLRQS